MAHGDKHKFGGQDPIDGDRIGIDFEPSTYTSTPDGVNSSDESELGSHLNGIDLKLAEVIASLVSFITSGDLTAALASYVTSSSLASTLASYVTNSSLTSTLASYVTNSSLTSTLAGYVASGRAIVAGAGLTGGGDLSSDSTLNVGANADGSIVVNANDIQVGVLATDAQHGNRGGGAAHSVATTLVSGFMSYTDKARFDKVPWVTAVKTSANSPVTGADYDEVLFDVSGGNISYVLPAASIGQHMRGAILGAANGNRVTFTISGGGTFADGSTSYVMYVDGEAVEFTSTSSVWVPRASYPNSSLVPDYSPRFSASAWHFNNISSLTDLNTTNNKALTAVGSSMNIMAGPRGKLAVSSAGGGFYRDKSDQSFKTLGAFSAECVIMPAQDGTAGGLFGCGAGNTNSTFNMAYSAFLDTAANGGFGWTQMNGSNVRSNLYTQLSRWRAIGNWFHLAFTRTADSAGSQTVTAYLNGVQVATGTCTTPTEASSANLNFWALQGCYNNSNTSVNTAVGGTAFAGAMSFLSPYVGRVLTANEVAYLARLRLGSEG